MTGFRVLVADDEPLARGMVADLLRRDPDIVSITECATVDVLRQALAAQAIDIAFLDIEMPEASGLDIAEHIGPEGPAVVFVTAYAQYAPHAFDVSATDYVLKPFSDARFLEAVGRAKRRVRERHLGVAAGALGAIADSSSEPHDASHPMRRQTLVVKDGDRTVVLEPSEILWIEAEDYYVLIHSTRGRHMVRDSMAAMEDRLLGIGFVRVHRGAIVNLHMVREIRDAGSLLLLSDGARVPVSRARRALVEAALHSLSQLRSKPAID